MMRLPDWARTAQLRDCAPGALARPCALAVGNFDGFHRGHGLLVERTIAAAERAGLDAAVLTFEPLPAEFLQGASAPPRLMALADKARYAQDAHPRLAALVVASFDAPFAARTPQAFARDILRDALRARHLVCGADFRFGRDRAGDLDLLRSLSGPCGFTLEVVEDLANAQGRISSSRVRRALASGDLAEAERLLGRPYAITAEVVAGRRAGRALGFPTANLDFPHTPALRGVFAGFAEAPGDVKAPCVINIGTRPTVDGARLTLEAHLLDFDQDLYGQPLSVRFAARLRDERRFGSVEELRAQIARDVAAARDALAQAAVP